MSDYTKTTNFTAKDALSTGDPLKLIKGSYFDTEFDAIATAVATKYDSGDLASQAQAEAETLNTVLMTPLRVANWADANSGIVGDAQALADPNADGLLGWDDSAGAGIFFTLGTGLAFDTTTVKLSHLGIEALTDPNADSVLFWDDSAGAAAWLTFNEGIEFSGTNTVGLTDVTAGAAQPVVITSGTFTFDLSSITTMSVEDVNVAQDGIVMSDNGTIKVLPLDEGGLDVIEVSNASQTFALTDANTFQLLTNLATSTKTWTIPLNATVAFKIGTCIMVGDRDGFGGGVAFQVVGDTGVTLSSKYRSASGASGAHTVSEGGMALLVKVAADEWMITGDVF